MTTFCLHIGMTKTGSTTLQVTFDTARPALLGHGVDYLDFGQNHNGVIRTIARGTPTFLKGEAARRLGIPKNTTDYDPKTVVDAFRALLKRPKAPIVVASGQGLYATLDVADLERLKAVLSDHVATTRIVVYVRDPTGWANSRSQELVKHGHSIRELTLLLQEDAAESQLVPRYARLQGYIDVFGRENVDIRVFDRRRFVAGDLVADFCAAIGAGPDLAKAIPIQNANSGMSAEALHLVEAHYNLIEQRQRAAAGVPPADPAGLTGADLTAARERFRKPNLNFQFRQRVRTVRGRPWVLPAEALAAIWDAGAADLAWLRQVTGEPGLFAEAEPRAGADPVAVDMASYEDIAALIEATLPASRGGGDDDEPGSGSILARLRALVPGRSAARSS